jgi:hypothetical protein
MDVLFLHRLTGGRTQKIEKMAGLLWAGIIRLLIPLWRHLRGFVPG